MPKYKKTTIDTSLAKTKLALCVPDAELVDDLPRTSDFREGKHQLHLGRVKGKTFDVCASIHPKYICCSTHVLRSISNCPFECSYCFLQNYLTNTTTSLIIDTDSLMKEITEKTKAEPWRFFRIGTWELGDSLALEEQIPAASELVERFAHLDNALLKLRTKTDYVDPLLKLNHGGKTVVSWTLNPDKIIKSEEFLTARLPKRLKAMKKVADAGYLVGLHFDPMLIFENWQTEYDDLIRQVFEAVPAQRVPWISIGSVRFNPEMKKTLENNYPGSRITAAEMVLGDDNKFRYVRPLRIELYKTLIESIKRHGGSDCFIYLCMERWNVWESVFGKSPKSTGDLDYLLTSHIFEKYPGLVHQKPIKELYEKASEEREQKEGLKQRKR